jgi:hypothetical protein
MLLIVIPAKRGLFWPSAEPGPRNLAEYRCPLFWVPDIRSREFRDDKNDRSFA